MSNGIFEGSIKPLEIDEVISFVKQKWGVTYEMRILIRGQNIFLQMMWGYLEQKSFPSNEKEFRSNLGKVIDVINRLGQPTIVRNWLVMTKGRPKTGMALSLRLIVDDRLKEFVL